MLSPSDQHRRCESKGCTVESLKVKDKAINIQYKMIQNKRWGWQIWGNFISYSYTAILRMFPDSTTLSKEHNRTSAQ